MIEFVTLFLALTWDVRPVEVAVGPQVAAVELHLDGRQVARLAGEPWSIAVDFGKALVPHVLEAIALDRDGRRLGKVRQTINFGRSAAEASLILDLDGSDAPRRARLVWQTYDQSQPKKIRAAFDGKKVEVADDGAIELPAYDPKIAHHLAARLTFEGSLVAEAELSFGGLYADRVTSELTAVPVLFPGDGPPPKPAAMAGWFAATGTPDRGTPVPVFSVEQDPGVVFLVRDTRLPLPLPLPPVPEASGKPPTSTRPALSKVEFRFVATTPHVARHGARATEIFLIANVDQDWNRRGLFEIARYLAPREQTGRRQQLFEAVALAARAAAATRRPRAVVLLLDPETPDGSRLGARQALDYLDSLRVPLFVWTAPRSKEQPSFAGGELDRIVRTDLAELADAVEESLAAQHVLWFEGPYLPHQIEISEAAPAAVRFPGSR